MSQPKPELCFMCNEPDYRGHTCDPVKAAVKPAPQPEPTPRQDTAFNRIMGLGSMPPDASGEYDRWLFEKSYEAGAASERARADAAERNLALSRQQYSDYRREAIKEYGQYEAEVESLRSELREAKQELADEIRMQKELAKATLPCGHLDQYGKTEDGGRHILCLECEVRDMREALTGAFNAAETFRKPCPTDIEWTAAIESLIKAERLLSRKEDKAQ